ncbi:hypothetical protein SLEP1_g15377 [Rubroshorea leprosula]|uniref:High mobility group B protein 6 n=1 Tax=Rubroshorea leprosula TaxID=152421 RepID=A0AAV5IWD4_9ROSI|nr:hypothetical protein SLEP1_g15377 [Rubroshorea leprosula]
MPTAQLPIAGDQKLRPKSGRKPLQPKNSLVDAVNEIARTKLISKQGWIEITPAGNLNKENRPIYATPTRIEPMDSSLAEELSAMRKKMERLRLDKEKTERMLRERSEMLDLQMKEMECRGEIQRELEIEVDRLYRLKELQCFSMRISPVRTLREKEKEKKTNETQSEEIKLEDLEEFVDENLVSSPGSDCAKTSKEEDDK